MQVAISLIYIIFDGSVLFGFSFRSVSRSRLVKTHEMAFGALETSGIHKNCRRPHRLRRTLRFQNVQLFSPMMLAGSFRVYLFNLEILYT